MNEAAFTVAVDRWIADVRDEALRLFAARVASEHCLPIAISIANAKEAKRALDRQQLAGVRPGMLGIS